MAYLETIEAHNARLEALKAKAESLPEAGSGGGGDDMDPLSAHAEGTLKHAYITSSKIIRRAFYGCSRFETLTAPNAVSIQVEAFACSLSAETALRIADFAIAETIASDAFNGCKSLIALVLRKTDAICTLSATDAFDNTVIKTGTGYIYIPAALKSQYEQASNWSTYASQFRALEDYTVDGTITGALDETKI